MIGYWVGQCVGAILAAWVLSVIVGGVGGGYSIASSWARPERMGRGLSGWIQPQFGDSSLNLLRR